MRCGVHQRVGLCTPLPVLWFSPRSTQALWMTRWFESHVLHRFSDQMLGPDFGSGLAGLDLEPVGELGDLVEHRATLGEELTDLAVGVHHGRVVAVAELGADLGQ